MRLCLNRRFGKVLASSLAVLCATAVYAMPKGPCDAGSSNAPKINDDDCSQPTPGPFAFAYPMDINLSCPRDFYFHVDGLAIQAKEDGLTFAATTGSTTTGVSGGQELGFSNNSHDFDYNPGIRFGLGFYLNHDAWNIDFNWTWINITNYKQDDPGSSFNVLLPEWLFPATSGVPQTGNTNQTVNAAWNAHYNTIDARIAKPYHISRFMIFTPHFGLRGGWIDQHFGVHYGSIIAGQNDTIAHADNNFWGIGSRIGIDTDWFLGKGWCLFANTAASMLFGKFDVSQSAVYSSTPGTIDLENKFYQNVPNFEIILGLGWNKFFDKNKYRISLKGAYEFHDWLNQNNLTRFFGTATTYAHDIVSRGDLTLNGFSFKVQFDL